MKNSYKIYGLVAFFITSFILIPYLTISFERNDLLYGFTSIAVLSMMAAGVWLTFYMGRINIGQGAYALIGGYTLAVLITKYEFSFWLALPFAGVVATLLSMVVGVPVLRLRGVYFAMVTLTMTEVARLISIALTPITNGPRGITGIPLPGSLSVFGFEIIPSFDQMENSKIGFYYLALVLMVITYIVLYRLVHSRIGALCRSLQQNEELASSLGVNIATLRVIAYSISSFFGGIGGAIFVSLTQSIYPTTFQVADSVNYMLYTFLGGLSFVFGPILGALVLYFSWDFLFIVKEFQLLIYSGILILLMLFLPNGLLSIRWKKKQ